MNTTAPDLSGLKPATQEVIRGWIADGTFIERAIGAMQDQERENMRLEKLTGTPPAVQPTITVEIRDVYGKPTVYPMDEAARVFADIAGTTTLTDMTLKRIKLLGYHINVTQRKIEI